MKQVNKIEEFKDVQDYYYVTTCGKLLSNFNRKVRILKLAPRKNGYLGTIFKTKDDKRLNCNVHRVVALAFIPNTDNKDQVNHIDENKENNAVPNLNWLTARENTRYSKSKTIEQYDKQGNFIREWVDAVTAAEETGIPRSGISYVCRGKRKTSGGFVWKFKNK